MAGVTRFLGAQVFILKKGQVERAVSQKERIISLRGLVPVPLPYGPLSGKGYFCTQGENVSTNFMYKNSVVELEAEATFDDFKSIKALGTQAKLMLK